MPGKLSDSKKRVSMAEEVEILDALKEIAKREGKTITDIYAEAARSLIKQKGKITKKWNQQSASHLTRV